VVNILKLIDPLTKSDAVDVLCECMMSLSGVQPQEGELIDTKTDVLEKMFDDQEVMNSEEQQQVWMREFCQITPKVTGCLLKIKKTYQSIVKQMQMLSTE